MSARATPGEVERLDPARDAAIRLVALKQRAYAVEQSFAGLKRDSKAEADRIARGLVAGGGEPDVTTLVQLDAELARRKHVLRVLERAIEFGSVAQVAAAVRIQSQSSRARS